MLEQKKIESHRAQIAICQGERLRHENILEAATAACAKAFAERRALAARYGEALGVLDESPMPLVGSALSKFREADAAWLLALREQRDVSTALLDLLHRQDQLQEALVKLQAKADKAA